MDERDERVGKAIEVLSVSGEGRLATAVDLLREERDRLRAAVRELAPKCDMCPEETHTLATRQLLSKFFKRSLCEPCFAEWHARVSKWGGPTRGTAIVMLPYAALVGAR